MTTNRIRALREARHMTQVRLSIELEVSQETVSAYESGKHYPSYPALVRMADLFGVSMDYLMGRDEEYVPREAALCEQEKQLLSLFRPLPPRLQERALAYLQGLGDQ